MFNNDASEQTVLPSLNTSTQLFVVFINQVYKLPWKKSRQGIFLN